jgi:hypothetical protein
MTNVTPRGELELLFNQEMLMIKNESSFDKVFKFSVISALELTESVGYYANMNGMNYQRYNTSIPEEVYFNFNWTIIDYNSKSLKFKFIFENPEKISSTNFGYDVLKIDIIKPEIFISKTFEQLSQDEVDKTNRRFELS